MGLSLATVQLYNDLPLVGKCNTIIIHFHVTMFWCVFPDCVDVNTDTYQSNPVTVDGTTYKQLPPGEIAMQFGTKLAFDT